MNGIGIITNSNDLYMAGENDHGSQLLGFERNVNEFCLVDRDGIWNTGDRLQFSFGFFHVYVIKNGIELYAAGSNDSGQLGLSCFGVKRSLKLIRVPTDHLNLKRYRNEFLFVQSGSLFGIFICGQIDKLRARIYDALNKQQLTDVTFSFHEKEM